MLEDLNKKSPDVAFSKYVSFIPAVIVESCPDGPVPFHSALKKLAIDEKARDAKKSSQFSTSSHSSSSFTNPKTTRLTFSTEGMYTKKSPAASTPATAATPPPPAAAPVAEQMSTAPVVKDKTPMVDLTTSESSEFTG
jgi:hypothetical protein